jgi:hypothetical protein
MTIRYLCLQTGQITSLVSGGDSDPRPHDLIIISGSFAAVLVDPDVTIAIIDATMIATIELHCPRDLALRLGTVGPETMARSPAPRLRFLECEPSPGKRPHIGRRLRNLSSDALTALGKSGAQPPPETYRQLMKGRLMQVGGSFYPFIAILPTARTGRNVGLSQNGGDFVGTLDYGGDNDDARECSRSGTFRRGATWACGVFGKMPRRRQGMRCRNGYQLSQVAAQKAANEIFACTAGCLGRMVR